MDDVAKTIGYLVIVAGALWFANVVYRDWSDARAARFRAENEAKWKEINPEGYAREMRHRANMERYKKGLPVDDPEWHADMQAAARNSRDMGLMN